jgi:hypothetical protein
MSVIYEIVNKYVSNVAPLVKKKNIKSFKIIKKYTTGKHENTVKNFKISGKNILDHFDGSPYILYKSNMNIIAYDDKTVFHRIKIDIDRMMNSQISEDCEICNNETLTIDILLCHNCNNGICRQCKETIKTDNIFTCPYCRARTTTIDNITYSLKTILID